MLHVPFVVICFATLVSACSGTGNDEHAYFAKHGPNYLVELKGRRRLMAHDPVSAVRGRTYEETLTIELPRIEGVIEGAEIPVRPGSLPYAGRVVITRGRMKVDLYYDNRDETPKVPLLWNGEYTLLRKDAAAAMLKNDVLARRRRRLSGEKTSSVTSRSDRQPGSGPPVTRLRVRSRLVPVWRPCAASSPLPSHARG